MTGNHTMAAVLIAQQAPLALLELSIPELKPGQVLVDLAYSGVCHTQLNEWRGARGPDAYLPHTLGHEGSGRVHAIGPGVRKVKPGDAVVLSWIKGSGADVPGTVYGSAQGPVNSGAVSTFLNRAVVAENRVTPIPETMPLKEAALLGCAIATGAGIVWNTAKVREGTSVLIIGAGGIGMAALVAAVASKAAPIIVLDVAAEKLEQARRLGAHHALDARAGDALPAILALVKGGVDVAIEAAGTRPTMELAFEATRSGGGLCVVAGNLGKGERIAIDPFALIAGKRIVGTWGGETNPDQDIPRYVDLYLHGQLPLEPLISRELPLAEINTAFQTLQAGKGIRTLIRLGAG